MDSRELNLLLKERMLVVYKYLVKNGCSHHDAEDIVQDTMIKAYGYIDGINIDKFNAWLFRVAINRFYDICRRKSRYPQLNIDDVVFIDKLSSDSNCDEYIVNCENKDQISRVINRLSAMQKNLLVLKYDMGLNYKEICEILDISEDNLKVYLYRARNSFKKYWEEEQYEKPSK